MVCWDVKITTRTEKNDDALGVVREMEVINHKVSYVCTCSCRRHVKGAYVRVTKRIVHGC